MLSIRKCKSIHFESRDADGAISTSELGKLMRSLGKMPTEAEVAEMMKQVHIHHICTLIMDAQCARDVKKVQ